MFLGRHPLTKADQYVSRSYTGKRGEAEAELNRLVAKYQRGGPEGQERTVDRLCDEWLDQLEGLGRSPTTLRGYRQKLAPIRKAFGPLRLNAVTPHAIDRYYGARLRSGAAPRTVLHEHRVFSTALRQAVKWNWLDEAPTDRATPPEPGESEVVAPSVDQLRALIDAATASREPHRAALIAFLALTGMRRGEACGLRWTDVDLQEQRIAIRRSLIETGDGLVERVPKTKRHRMLALGEIGTALLRGRRLLVEEMARSAGVELAPGAYVWSDDQDGSAPLRPGTLTQFLRRLSIRCGFVQGKAPLFHLHSLRHFAATHLVSEGVDIRTVAARLGHADPSITLRVYSHAISERDRAAADVLGLALGPSA